MSDAQVLLISVRGEASLTVEPDRALFYAGVQVARDSPSAAMATVAGYQRALIDDLAGLGGVALSADNDRSPLTWSFSSAGTHPEFGQQPDGSHGPTGATMAHLRLSISCRDFDLLQRVGAVLVSQADLNVDSIGWSADADNPGWPTVRAAAIAAAMQKGADYAVALGTTVASVEHVADVGLLGGDSSRVAMSANDWVAQSQPMSGGGGVPSLDPLPQQLQAAIEARFRASR